MKISGKITNPGEMRTKIILEERALETNAGGFSKIVGGRQIEVWCQWINAHGSEAWQANALGVKRAATILIRYQPDLDETWRVIHKGDAWEIRSIDNLRERNEYQELKVAMIGAG